MKLRLLTCAILASITAVAGVATSATASSPYESAVALTQGAIGGKDYQLGVTQLQDQLSKGDGRAALALAKLALTNDTNQDKAYPRAIELYRQAAALNTEGSELQLATALMRQGFNLGASTPEGKASFKEARTRFEKLAADPAQAEANWNLGYMETMSLPEAGDFPTGVGHIRVAADAGHSMASYWMASYLNQLGQGDRPERLAYLRAAAARGHSLAKQDLAKIEPKPEAAAAIAAATQEFAKQAWTSLTEEATDLVASINVKDGVKVASLDATPPTSVPAQGAHTTAAAPVVVAVASVPAAPAATSIDLLKQERDGLQASLTRTQVELDDARRQLAKLTQDHIVLPSSLNQQGLTAVMENDYETALAKFREAAKFDYAPAIANLGLMYLNGTAVPQDGKQAIALFKRAASLGNVTAAENAGRAYDYGIGVYRSRYYAIEWYQKAIAMGSPHAAAAVARLKAEP